MSGWNQQFQAPDFDDLLSALKPQQREAVSSVRAWAREHIEERPKLSYYQSSWGWAEQYELAEPHPQSLGGVYLIPEPDRPRVAICCDRRFFGERKAVDLPRNVQPGIRSGVCVGRFVWIECPLGGEQDAAGVCQLLDELAGIGSDG